MLDLNIWLLPEKYIQNNQWEVKWNLQNKVTTQVLEWKIKIDNTLEFENIDTIKSYFDSLWFENYYDFYFYQVKEFKNILKNNLNLKKIFKEIVWVDNLKKSYIWIEQILIFANSIWYKKLNVKELKNNILKSLNKQWINTLNEFNIYWLNHFKKQFNSNSLIKFYIYKKFKKSFLNIDSNDYFELWKLLWLELLDKDKIKIELKNVLKNKWIIYLDDLSKLKVREFTKLFWENLLLKSIFKSNNITQKNIQSNDILEFWINIWLLKKEINDSINIKQFLRDNSFFSYSDFKWIQINEIRTILWENASCRKVLEWFWLEYAKDFRLDHLKRFSRYIWFENVPNDIVYDENKTILFIKNILLENWVDNIYTLKVKWVKFVRNLFKENKIWKYNYKDVNIFMNNNLDFSIIFLKTENLIKLWECLWLKDLNDKEHKVKILLFLEIRWINLDDLSKNLVKTKFCSNIHFKYFLEIEWITNIKELRVTHVNNMKKYIKCI